MEAAVQNLEKQMLKTDETLDNLAAQVGNIETELCVDCDGSDVHVMSLLKSVHDVKNNYQSLRKEISEVQDLQKELSSTLEKQVKMMQRKCNYLKEKLAIPKDKDDKDEHNILATR